MPAYPDSLLALIDSRVAAGGRRDTKMGTVNWRSSGDLAGEPGMYAATVVFDGSSGTAQPVKCFESVIVVEGDRVGVIRYEGEWIITGNYTLRNLADGAYSAHIASSGTTSSGTYVDMPNSPTAIITVKHRDNTRLRIGVEVAMYSTVAATVVEVGVNISSTDGSIAYDENVIRRALNTANAHTAMGGWCDTAEIAGGVGYAVTARWRRVSGTGVLTTDGNDGVYIRIEEVD